MIDLQFYLCWKSSKMRFSELAIKHHQIDTPNIINNKIDVSVKAEYERKLNMALGDFIDEINQVDGYFIITYHADGKKVQRCEPYNFPQHLLPIVIQRLSYDA